MRNLDPCSAYLSRFHHESLKSFDDFKLEDIKVDHDKLSDDMDGWTKHTPVLLSRNIL